MVGREALTPLLGLTGQVLYVQYCMCCTNNTSFHAIELEENLAKPQHRVTVMVNSVHMGCEVYGSTVLQ